MITYLEVRKVASLTHEAWDDSVEDTALISVSLLASAKSFEVINRLGNNISIKAHFNTSKRFSTSSYVKVYSLGNIRACCATAEQIIKEAHLKLRSGYY